MKIKIIIPIIVFISLILITNACNTDNYTQGKILYDKYCVNCHGENGENLAELIPPLSNSDYLVKYPEKVACLIYYGFDGEITVNGIKYNHQMPANQNFNDIDVANVINYINNNLGNKNGYMSLKSLQDALNNCEIGESGKIEN